MLDNADWLDQLDYIPFLRDVGRHFSVNRMLTHGQRQAAAGPRAAADLPRIQLHAPAELRFPRAPPAPRRARCRSAARDQWGNIVSGIELGRRMDGAEVFGLTTPLITTASGAKMGKTAAGAVWLNADRRRALRLLAVLAQHRGRAMSAASCACSPTCRWTRSRRLEALGGAEVNEAKKILATEATRPAAWPRGRRRPRPTPRGAPSSRAWRPRPCPPSPPRLPAGLLDLAVAAGLAASKGEARRLVGQSGLRLNDEVVRDPRAR